MTPRTKDTGGGRVGNSNKEKDAWARAGGNARGSVSTGGSGVTLGHPDPPGEGLAETRCPEEQLAARPAGIWAGATNSSPSMIRRAGEKGGSAFTHIYIHRGQSPASKGAMSPATRTHPSYPPPGLDTGQKACPGCPKKVLIKWKLIHESAQALAAGSFITKVFSFQFFSAKPFAASGGEVISSKHCLAVNFL